MRLADYWGVGPKTSEQLTTELGTEAAIDAIESADVRALVDAGIPRGRATRILRRAAGDAEMDVLATGDTRSVYDDLLTRAASYALTEHAADRIRVLTPLADRDRIEDRLTDVLAARDAWGGLPETDRERVREAFAAYDEAGGSDRAAVETAITLRKVDLAGDPFAPLSDLDPKTLRDAAGALGYLRESPGEDDRADEAEVDVLEGADAELDRLRDQLAAAAELESSAFDVIDDVRDGSVRDFESFKGGVIDHVATRTSIDPGRIRAAAPEDAVDAADFVSETLRTLHEEAAEEVAEREATVAADLRDRIHGADGDVETAVEVVSEVAFLLSLGRFAAEEDLRRPELVDDGLAVFRARNRFIEGPVEPVTYGVGDHSIESESAESPSTVPPTGDRVTVLTGANSGGKTTLLETLCAVALLAAMGLPVPAEHAEVGRFDRIVFHRRHASFNAGVLESTLKSVVPPLVESGRTLMLVDEFEAITEPGRAADLLNGLVDLTVDRGALGVYVTHLADDLSPLPERARIDGIFAEGLTQDLALQVDYQPRFGTVGKSTPEFIVSRLVANADDRAVRGGFERLAESIGEEAVQRTLSDVRWSPE
ncbi:MutS domain V [Halopenitus malekzadehii]|uniref:MutS domain V n=1 Tax=Halopenitus malekzadehii TaxID=1267564 RepID=A0A1H6J5B1_9EURY|nr:DNA mismatch repair protein [Halopenitus malekzadehii]SEH55452.1 MutS domain V [Halopenitus malekzadehii]